jgi:hypothetical protein
VSAVQHQRVIVLAIAILLGTLVPVGTARAQPDSPATMRQRVAELEDQLAEVRAELGRIAAERDRLRAEVDRLRRAVAPGVTNAPQQGQPPRGDPARPSVPVSALSQDPLASPDALFVALLLDYRESFTGDPAASSLPDEDAVGQWVREMRGDLSGPARWLVSIDRLVRDERTPDRPARLRANATVLDNGNARPISRPVLIEIPKRMEARFPDAIAPGETLFAELRVKVGAAPVFQPGRQNAGPFDYPPFIGPYAGFAYDLDIAGLRFIDDAEIAALREQPSAPVRR